MTDQTTPDPSTEETIFDEAEFSMAGYDKHVRHARTTLYVLAVLVLFGLAMLPRMEGPAKWFVMGFVLLMACVFAALGVWSRKKPYAALLTALIIFVAIQVVNAVLAPATIIQAWYVKIAVIVLLILGVRNAKEIKDRAEIFGQDR